MLLGYIDESSCQSCLYVAVVLCPESKVTAVTQAVDAVMENLASTHPTIPSSTELHGYEISQGKGVWSGLDLHERIEVYRDALRILEPNELQVILRGIDGDRMVARYGPSTPDQHEIALSQLVERVDTHGHEVNQRILLICDEIGSGDKNSTYRRNLKEYQLYGSPGYVAGYEPAVIDTFHFVPSVDSRLVQLADLVVYLHHRIKTTRPDTDPRAIAAAAMLWELVEPTVLSAALWAPPVS